jgi:hypothetical protein
MIREWTIAAVTGAAVAAAVVLAPVASAGPNDYDDAPGHYATDVPGMVYDAHLTGPCDNYQLFTFGRGPGGETLACHCIPTQWPPVYTGFWQASYPLAGPHDIGTPCPGPKFASQAPDGRPMVCLGAQGWQPGTLTGAGFFPG